MHSLQFKPHYSSRQHPDLRTATLTTNVFGTPDSFVVLQVKLSVFHQAGDRARGRTGVLPAFICSPFDRVGRLSQARGLAAGEPRGAGVVELRGADARPVATLATTGLEGAVGPTDADPWLLEHQMPLSAKLIPLMGFSGFYILRP